MRRRTLLAGALAVPAGIALAPQEALAGPQGTAAAGARGGAVRLPATIHLPNGWQPEGIAIGRGPHFYVGSLVNGAIYRGSLLTGRGAVLVPGTAGGQATGLEFDHHGRLWACGGQTGGAAVYDPHTGARLAHYDFGGAFVNDAVATEHAVYFTDSQRPYLYAVPLRRSGRLPRQRAVRTLPLTGGLGEAGAFNNGIEATPEGHLLIVQTMADRLWRYDPRSGAAVQVDLGGASVLNGDGLLRRGPFLYVVRNFSNVIAKFRLHAHATAARLVDEITDPRFDVPATVAAFGPYLYAVNARFEIAQPTPDTPYTVVRVRA